MRHILKPEELVALAKLVILGLLAIPFLIGCTSQVVNPTKVNQLPKIYPDYTGVTIPAEIAPLNFNWVEDDIDGMDVVVKGSKGGELHVHGDEAAGV